MKNTNYIVGIRTPFESVMYELNWCETVEILMDIDELEDYKKESVEVIIGLEG